MIQCDSEFARTAKMGASEQLRDAAIEAFNPAIGLWMLWRDQAVFSAKLLAGLVKGMLAGGFAFTLGGKSVGEFFAIVPHDFLDFEWTDFRRFVEN